MKPFFVHCLALTILGWITAAHAHQQYELQALLSKARSEQRTEEIIKLSDQIIARDVIADFISDGPDLTIEAMRGLRDAQELSNRMNDWQDELASHPDSERLNYLLALAGEALPGRSGRGIQLPHMHTPLHIRISRESERLSCYFLDKRGHWSQVESAKILIPPNALVGFCGSAITARFSKPSLLVKERSALPSSWKEQQISRPSTLGKIQLLDESIEFKGAGFPPNLQPYDDVFFAHTEINSQSFSLEVVIDDIGTGKSAASAGLMIRSSMNPGAAYMAILLQRDENTLQVRLRERTGDASKYWTKLCSLRPHDKEFIERCLSEMTKLSLNEDALVAADRLLKKEPGAFRSNPDLYHEIYRRSRAEDRLFNFTDLDPAPNDDLAREEQIAVLSKRANQLQGDNQQEEAVLCWQKMRKLSPDQKLPTLVHQQMLIALMKLEQIDQLKAELRTLFLDQPIGDNRNTSAPIWTTPEEMLSLTSLQEPCLVPPFMPSIAIAAEYGMALDIAEELEKRRGPQSSAALTVATVLRLAGQDPRFKKGKQESLDAYVTRLAKGIPLKGLMLLAYQLQLNEQTRPAASVLITRMLSQTKSQLSPDETADLLLWRKRLNELTGDANSLKKDEAEIVSTLQDGSGSRDSRLLAAGIASSLKNDNQEQAKALSESYLQHERRPKHGAFGRISDTFDLVDLHGGDAVPLPIIWSSVGGESIQLNWEFSPNNWFYNPQREVRPRGVAIPKLNGRYGLDIYAVRGQSFGSEIDQEDLLVSLPSVNSVGQWTGSMPADRRWVLAVLRSDKGGVHSPTIPVVGGKNLLSPLDIGQLLEKKGSWTSSSKWLWGGQLKGGFPADAIFVSRLQPRTYTVPIDHAAVPIDPNGEYVLASWLKTDNGQDDAGGHYHPDAVVGVIFFDDRGNEVGTFSESTITGGRWTLVTALFGPRKTGGMKMIPPTASTAQVRIQISTQCEIAKIGFYSVGTTPKVN